MKPQSQIIAIAELDGWKLVQKTIPVWTITQYDGSGEWINKVMPLYENDGATKKFENLPIYLHSRDAIMPVIEKQEPMILHRMNEWLYFLPQQQLKHMLLVSAAQLCEALLRATGKWIEGE